MRIANRAGTALTLALVCLYSSDAPQHNNAPGGRPGPSLVLWAWERPEDLRFVDPSRVGVAFLAGTLRLSGANIYVSPRVQPLKLPQDPWLMAVVRLESDPDTPPGLSEAQRARARDVILEIAKLPGVAGIQIDFDATASQRDFYRHLIFDVEKEISSSLLFSITALATWCWFDGWIRDLPVGEVIPMLFSMGPESGTLRRLVQRGADFPVKRCRGCLGMATDEIIRPVSRRERLYLFHPRPWTPEALETVIREIGR